MIKILISCALLLAASPFLSAQKTIKDDNAEKRTIAGFHGIIVSTGIELILTEGTKEEVVVSAASTEFRDKIITRVENGILKIIYDNKLQSINTKKEKKFLKAYVSFKTLSSLEANTGAMVEIEGILKSEKLKLNANTGALVKGKISVTALKISQSTGSDVTLTGDADKLEIDGDTGSIFKGTGLAVSICSVKVSTGAGVTVTANKELTASASTGGYVKYKGEPAIREMKKSTGGVVSKI